jgi:hypothetical protein
MSLPARGLVTPEMVSPSGALVVWNRRSLWGRSAIFYLPSAVQTTCNVRAGWHTETGRDSAAVVLAEEAVFR